eukprot:Lithocolla_globosa_v1_NODE_2044_length_2195_cov_128.665421.p2 type:complete len:173 gc:universal NODE_2044_length_2195_cov_128.665421:1903-1385(-)
MGSIPESSICFFFFSFFYIYFIDIFLKVRAFKQPKFRKIFDRSGRKFSEIADSQSFRIDKIRKIFKGKKFSIDRLAKSFRRIFFFPEKPAKKKTLKSNSRQILYIFSVGGPNPLHGPKTLFFRRTENILKETGDSFIIFISDIDWFNFNDSLQISSFFLGILVVFYFWTTSS